MVVITYFDCAQISTRIKYDAVFSSRVAVDMQLHVVTRDVIVIFHLVF